MAYVYALDVALPANTNLVSQGALNIRELKAAVKERINSAFVSVDNDPLVGKDGLTLGGTNVKALTPIADNTYALGTATFRFSDLRVNTATLSSNLTVGGTAAVTGNLTFSGNVIGSGGKTYLTVNRSYFDGGSNAFMQGSALSATADIDTYTLDTLRLRVATGGQLLIGTTVTTGAAAGELVVGKGKSLRSVDDASGTRNLIRHKTGYITDVGDDGSFMEVNLYDGATSFTSKRVTFGANDSGGAGYKVMRVPN